MNDVFLDEIVQPGAQEPRRDRNRRRAERDRRRQQRRRKSGIAVLVALLILAGGAYAVVQWGLPMLRDGLDTDRQQSVDDYPGPPGNPVEIEIPAGATGAQMASILVEADVVASRGAFTRAFDANPAAAGIQPGTYRLLEQMPAADAVNALLDGENRVQMRVTIPEGQTVTQILETLSSKTAIPVEDLEAAMADPAAVGLPAEAGGSYEGWLFPATYPFEPGTAPADMISTMIQQTVRVLDERGVAPENRQAVLIKASLVERESPDSDEARTTIAGAIENRLEQGMKLDIDAAVAYGLGISGTELTNAHKETDGPYNLYLRVGLPPTPIASPGTAAIDAVLNPADVPYLYWVTVNHDTGETKFAETYPEHRENVAELRQWEAENQG